MLRRIAPATAAIALLATGLAGCSAGASPAENCNAGIMGGSFSENVTVGGGFGEQANVEMPEGGKIRQTQRTIVDSSGERDSAVAENDTLLGVNIAYFDATTGFPMHQEGQLGSSDTGSFVLVSEATAEDPLTDALRCAAEGDRLVVAMSAEDSATFAVSATGQTRIPNFVPGTSLVAVADVVEIGDLAASGRERALPAGFPSVATNEDGRPGVVLPPQAAPTETRAATRIVGEGAEVGADDTVVVQLLAVGWDGEQLDNTWEASPGVVGPETPIEQGGVPFRAELTGQTVGSQRVVIDTESGEARVLVIDILSAVGAL